MKETASCLCLEEIVSSKLEEIYKEKEGSSIRDACGKRVGKRKTGVQSVGDIRALQQVEVRLSRALTVILK